MPTYPEHDDDWIEVAEKLENLAERIRAAVAGDARKTSIFTQLRPTPDERDAIRAIFTSLSDRSRIAQE
jgi:hypothetical protein